MRKCTNSTPRLNGDRIFRLMFNSTHNSLQAYMAIHSRQVYDVTLLQHRIHLQHGCG